MLKPPKPTIPRKTLEIVPFSISVGPRKKILPENLKVGRARSPSLVLPA